ncbi:hypothetical protein EVAR_69972_1 [Eumeta japonica]|uniref:Uncharacterized protein n=1 Tax=Eumeta variegata TaxID=151549 RepID=A0A4C1SR70_EUMVA|nr:hypothetical protein EVAR_69972_1 [Eumeta japonica]
MLYRGYRQHPKSEVTKCAAIIRKQMEESTGEQVSDDERISDVEDEPVKESAQARHHREVEEIINASLRPKSPRTLDTHEFPSLQEVAGNFPLPRKQKSRDLDRALSRQRKDRERGDRNERSERDRDRYSSHNRRHHSRSDSDVLDPMDPSSYSDTPRGKWSDGLVSGGDGEDRKRKLDESKNVTKLNGSLGVRITQMTMIKTYLPKCIKIN